jgi:catechol 2,3-dioxygenase-like lactoylglutathione lyase family enzyme
MVGANDIEESKKFYDSTLGVLGAEPGVLSVNPTGHKRYMYFLDGGVLLISEPIDDQEATKGNGSTIGFSVTSSEQGDKWHEAGINSGGTTCEGPPGIREGMGVKLYLAYLRDPSGNKLCGIQHLTP